MCCRPRDRLTKGVWLCESCHSTFTHLRGGLDSEFRKLLIPLNLDEPPRRHCRLFSIYGHSSKLLVAGSIPVSRSTLSVT